MQCLNITMSIDRNTYSIFSRIINNKVLKNVNNVPSLLAIFTFLAFSLFFLVRGLGWTSENNTLLSPIQNTRKETENRLRSMPKALGNSAEQKDTILIGIVVSLTGEVSPWGVEGLRGARLAIDEFNQNGGYHGKKIALLIGDSGSKPEQARSVAEKLIGQGIIGMIGDITSGGSAQVAKACFDRGVPVITIGGTRKDLSDIGANFFRVCFTDDFQGPVMAKFAYDELNLRKIASFIDRKQPYSLGLGKGFKNRFLRLGGKIIDEEYYESGQTQFGAQLTNVKSKSPDGLFVAGYYPEAGPIVRQAKSLKINVQMLGGDGWDNEQILVSGGTAIIGGYYCTHFSTKEKRKEVQNFVTNWKDKYGDYPKTITSALGYDSTKLMMDSLKRTKTLNSRSLLLAIENTENFPELLV